MRTVIIMLIFFSFNLLAEVSNEVLIRGKVHNIFDEQTVHIIDEFGEIVIIPREHLPKDLKIKQGTPISIEINQSLLKFTKKKKI